MLNRDMFKKYMQQVQKTMDKDDMLSGAIEKACNDDCYVIGLYGAECSAMVDLLSQWGWKSELATETRLSILFTI